MLREGGLTRAERAAADVAAGRALALAGVEVVSTAGDRGAALAALRADPDVTWAEPNRPRRLSADPLTDLLWGLRNVGQSVWGFSGTPDADIDAPEAWGLAQGAGTTVAVVDTGVALDHPDLAGRLVPGWDWVGDDDGTPEDEHGHGTHVAGIVAAGDNGIGVVGVAPLARVMPLRVLDGAGSGNSADVADAFAYAGARGVSVVNASLGSDSMSYAERLMIRRYPDTLFVVAAGNDGGGAQFPCALDEPNVLCVGASDAADRRAAFSNFGAVSVDLFAPGTNTVSTFPVDPLSKVYIGLGAGWAVMSGTSMASPHVAGAAALAAELRGDWRAPQLKAALLDGADRLPALTGLAVTGGRLNAASTVRIAGGDGGHLAPTLGADPAPPPAAPAPVAAPAPAAVAVPRPTALRVHGSPRVCRRSGCQARTAQLSFSLAAGALVAVRLERRRCASGHCAWRAAGTRRRAVPAGATRWRLTPRLLGMRLTAGSWRVTLATSAGAARRAFPVRAA